MFISFGGDMAGESVVVITAGVKLDPYSQEPVGESWADADTSKRAVTTLVPPEPRPSDEPVQDARNAVVSGFTLYLPPGDPVSRLDRIRVRGEDYPVQGDPARWVHSTIVQVFRTKG